MIFRLTAITIAVISVMSGANAFSVHRSFRTVPRTRHALATDFETAMPESVSAHEKIGISEDQLALGVDPEDVFNYIGTREDLIERTLNDVKEFNRAKAEVEVDKMLLDAEALNIFIQFQKMKEQDPDFKVPTEQEEDGLFSLRTVVILYLAYVATSIGGNYFRGWVAQKEAAGEWQGTNIPFIDDWIANTPAPAAVSQAIDVTMNVDAVNADTLQAVADTVQTVSDSVQLAGM